MIDGDLELRHIATIVERHCGAPPRDLSVVSRPLQGGLEAAAVRRVVARYRDHKGRAHSTSFIAKRLDGPAAREAAVYEWLLATHGAGLSPALLTVHRTDPAHAILYLQEVRPADRWPWRNTDATSVVLDRLATFHVSAQRFAAGLPAWTYEEALQASAEATLEALERHAVDPRLSMLRRAIPWTRRIVRALPELRRQLLTFAPLGRGPIHGDVHPGNVLLRGRTNELDAVFIDWGRARIGSPLEDVSSWLQSLGVCEPEARRRHDTLLRRYLLSRGLTQPLSSDLRAAYWVAGACNALAGALRYHVHAAASSTTRASRERAMRFASDWLRVVRRADASTR